MEVERLKRQGQNVQAIEWYVTELEGNLRRNGQGASAQRHLRNNLNHEIEVLKRQRQ